VSISAEASTVVTEATAAAAERLPSGGTADPFAVDVSDRLAVTDAFLLLTGANEPQVTAMVEAIEQRLRKHDLKPKAREGSPASGWVLLDYVDAVVHVFLPEQREHYSLERLWKDCPVISVDTMPTEQEPTA
jgi:ribosome-associated protein